MDLEEHGHLEVPNAWVLLEEATVQPYNAPMPLPYESAVQADEVLLGEVSEGFGNAVELRSVSRSQAHPVQHTQTEERVASGTCEQVSSRRSCDICTCACPWCAVEGVSRAAAERAQQVRQ